MADDDVLLQSRSVDGVVTLTLHRPSRRNALGAALVEALRETIARLADDRTARVVILTGAGEKAFCAGADLKERRTMDEAKVAVFVSGLRAMMDELARLPQPTIAAIGAAALGGGAELALACDLRVMTRGAVIGLPETHLGIIPGAGGTQRLPRLIGVARAKELIYTGARIGADRAEAIGLINCACENALTHAQEMARAMVRAAPIALIQAKQAIDQGIALDLAAAMAVEKRCYDVTIPTEDRLEALAAFREKRAPSFKGR